MNDERGISLVEVLVTIVILAGALMSLAAASGHAARQLYHSRTDMNYWAAVQATADSIASVGYDNLANGSATVQGYPMNWSVSGTDPKTLILRTQRTNRTGDVLQDSLVMYFPAADTLI